MGLAVIDEAPDEVLSGLPGKAGAIRTQPVRLSGGDGLETALLPTGAVISSLVKLGFIGKIDFRLISCLLRSGSGPMPSLYL